MLFNSIEFIKFFLIVTIPFFFLPLKWRWWLLLGASCYFYMAFVPKYLLILFALILVDYMAGLLIARGHRKKLLLILSLSANLLFLGFFKYWNFFSENTNSLFTSAGWGALLPQANIVLPIGLSFHTFQSMAYTIEIYKGKIRPEKNLVVYALYVLFYPQLVAGPIERPQHMIAQFHQKTTFNWNDFFLGIKWTIWGFFKKLIIADRCALFVDSVFGQSFATGSSAWIPILATYAFAFQIYCDFSGYSDIARGVAKIMGYDLMVNFNYPYIAESISEFWRRWHISLSTWFRDYLYIPLGGSKTHPLRWRANLLLVFLVSGLWHGANWTFVVWGGLHGIFLIAGTYWKTLKMRFLPNSADRPQFRWLMIFWTFNLVSFAWIFFRAKSLHEAKVFLNTIIHGTFNIVGLVRTLVLDDRIRTCSLAILILLLAEFLFRLPKEKLPHFWRDYKVQSLLCGFAIAMIIAYGVLNSVTFIYFQF